MSEKRQIVVEDVLEMLEAGKTRAEIKEHYGLNGVELKKLFQHEDLKGKRTHKERSFEIVTRADLNGGEPASEVTETVEEEAPEMEEAEESTDDVNAGPGHFDND